MTAPVRPLIPVARPLLGEPEVAAARRAILSGWVTQGPEVAAFEREFAATVGAPHACAVSSCTTALHLALLAAGAIGSEIEWHGEWQRIGRPHGDVACFSFHPRKLLSTGDGGMLVTARAELDETFRRLRQHGMSVPDSVRHASARVVFEDYP